MGHYLHPNQATALCTVLSMDGKATPAMLSRHLFLERHSVSELITRMEEKGLVRKTRDTERKNIVRIKITEKGRKMALKVIQIDFIRGIMSHLSSEQQEQLRTGLNVLLGAALQEMGVEEIKD